MKRLYLLPTVHQISVLQYIKVLKGHNGRLVNQFPLGLSPLRNEFFTYNIIENPFCPSCGDHIENLKHFLFECNTYCQPRTILLNSITALCDYVSHDFNISLDYTSQSVITHLLTHGINLPQSEDLTKINVNSVIFNHFSKYISQTRRFMQIVWCDIELCYILRLNVKVL